MFKKNGFRLMKALNRIIFENWMHRPEPRI